MALVGESFPVDCLPKDLLAKLQQNIKSLSPSVTDKEVERSFVQEESSPSSPKSTYSDDVFFKSSRTFTESDDDARSQRSFCSDNRLPSPGPERGSFAVFGDNSDWMLAERTKYRSPPVSPSHSSSRYMGFSPVADRSRDVLDRPQTRSPLSCIIPPRYGSIDRENCNERSPIKCPGTPSGQSDKQSCRTPVRSGYSDTSKHALLRSPGGHYRVDRSMERSPSPRCRDQFSESRVSGLPFTESRAQGLPFGESRVPALPTDLYRMMCQEDMATRQCGARKQLSFDGGFRNKVHHELEPEYDSYMDRRRYRASSDSDVFGCMEDDEDSRLISKFISHLNKRKRKMSERFDDDYEDDIVINAKRKRKELEKRMNQNYLKQLEADVNMLNNKLEKQDPEIRPDNCSCAVMEKQFLEMAENAYKNIRRQDMSGDGFAQFRKELNDTNEILKESLKILENIKECCEHRRVLRC